MPHHVRPNAWWPADVVARWQIPFAMQPPAFELSPAARDIAAAMKQGADDPFYGVEQRHVLEPDEDILDFEASAARQAIESSGVAAEAIDVLLLHRSPVDHQLTNIAGELHARLGLRRDCLSLQTEGAQHTYLLQTALARGLLASGHARCALLVQSSAVSRVLDPRTPLSGVFGDGATATVFGAVTAGRGVLGMSHRTDGAHPNALVATTANGRWFDEGVSVLQIRDPIAMRDVLLKTVDVTTDGIDAACASAGIRPADIDVFVMHQGQVWLRDLVQKHAGLVRARSISTIASTGHLFSAFLPSALVAAQQRGMLADDCLVLLASGGTGMTYGACVMRWGR